MTHVCDSDSCLASIEAKVRSLPPTISVERAGQLLGVSRGTAYQAVREGQIPSLRLGRRLVVPTAKLLVLLGVQTDGKDRVAA